MLDLALFGDHERQHNRYGHIRNCGANLEHEWHHSHERNAGDGLMPWKSQDQAAWGHSPAGKAALGGDAAVAEWDAATPKGSLPKKKKQIRYPGALGRARSIANATHGAA